MPTSTRNKNEDTVQVEPEEYQMFEREGFDRPGIRRELAGVSPISLDDLFMERDEEEFVDPRTLNMDFGPTGMGEVGEGTGIETVRIDGEEWRTIRYADGFETLAEEDVNDPEMQRNAILEKFDFLADANFLKGVKDYGRDTTIRQGFFDWIDSAIPSDRVLNAQDYADGSEADYDSEGVEENLIKFDAYKRISGDLLTRDDPNWDMMIGRQEALAQFNKISGSEGGVGGVSYMSRINSGEASGGVNDMKLVPSELKLDTLPHAAAMDAEPPTIDLTTELGSDEVYLIPDASVMRNDWVRLSEMPSPETFGPYELRQGREAWDYVWRYSHKFDPHKRFPKAKDAVKITNVSELFN